jgi:hypothetical protein
MKADINLEPGGLEAITKGCTCPQAVDMGPSDGSSRLVDWGCLLHGMMAVQRALLDEDAQFNSRAERPNLNSGRAWSDDDDRDLVWRLRDDQDIDEIADFLRRTPSEIRARIEERGLGWRRTTGYGD